MFKDFAGPVAAVIASFVAAIVTIHFARHQKRIAEEQTDIAKHKLRYDLYTRRFEIFNAIFPFYLRHDLVGRHTTYEAFLPFLEGLRHRPRAITRCCFPLVSGHH